MIESGGSSVFRQKGPSLWGENLKGNKRIEKNGERFDMGRRFPEDIIIGS